MFFKKTTKKNITGDGSATLTVNTPTDESRSFKNPFLDKHNIIIDRGTYTAGTITLTATSIDAEGAESVYDSGSAITVDFSSQPETIQLEGYPVVSFTVSGASMSGGSNDWNVTIVSGY